MKAFTLTASIVTALFLLVLTTVTIKGRGDLPEVAEEATGVASAPMVADAALASPRPKTAVDALEDPENQKWIRRAFFSNEAMANVVTFREKYNLPNTVPVNGSEEEQADWMLERSLLTLQGMGVIWNLIESRIGPGTAAKFRHTDAGAEIDRTMGAWAANLTRDEIDLFYRDASQVSSYQYEVLFRNVNKEIHYPMAKLQVMSDNAK